MSGISDADEDAVTIDVGKRRLWLRGLAARQLVFLQSDVNGIGQVSTEAEAYGTYQSGPPKWPGRQWTSRRASVKTTSRCVSWVLNLLQEFSTFRYIVEFDNAAQLICPPIATPA